MAVVCGRESLHESVWHVFVCVPMLNVCECSCGHDSLFAYVRVCVFIWCCFCV